ncbi:MAG: sodium/proline symporter [uncultured Gemmatimonadaceae bacterium]|uniref:Sodium/proline symporter n=1 Tax=uncultured Gemmatimonadaceae bacterium TaxID=246130 RepID=A0A6J4KWG4_9BACT|nr:MAG: sodium/proline symporter [uncultured Gemmatimonadaceae bacterium]
MTPLLLLLQKGAAAGPMQRVSDPTIVAVALAYFAVVAAISVWAARRTRTASDFFVAGHGIGLVALTVASVSTSVSGFAFIGGPGLLYTVGLGALFIVLPAAVTNVLGAWVLAKRMRLLGEARGLMTVPDAIGARYRSPLAQGLSGVAMLVAIVGYMATNALAMGYVLDAIFGVGITAGIWVGMGVTLAYSVAGGILAGVYNDVFQGTLMALASAAVFAVVLSLNDGLAGISRSIAPADPEFLSPFGKLTPLAALSFFFVFGMGSLGQPQAVHKYYMIRDPRQLKWYPLLKTLGQILVLLLFFGVGVGVRAMVADGRMPPLVRPDEATPSFLLRFTPALLAGLVFSGVAAATMSATNSFINIGAAVVTRDLPRAFGRALRNELRWARVATLAIAVVATVLAQLSGSLVAFLGIFGWGLFASTLVPSLAVGLNWAGATRAGAIASISVGLVVTLVLETLAFTKRFSFPAGVSGTAVALVLSLLVFFAVSWLTRANAAAELDPDVRLVMEV